MDIRTETSEIEDVSGDFDSNDESPEAYSKYTPDGYDGDGPEPESFYDIGGHCPLELGVSIGPGLGYRLVHKLSTSKSALTWLCYDEAVLRWTAVKVYAASCAEEGQRELRTFEILSRDLADPVNELLKVGIATCWTSFWIRDSPNGDHLCLVLPVPGPSFDMGSYMLSFDKASV